MDSLGDIAAAMNHALAGFGWPTHDLDAYRELIGEGVDVLARRASPSTSDADVQRPELVVAYQRYYAEHLLDATRPYPGLLELCATLRARGVPMAVLSNKPDAPTRRIADALFPAGTFVAAWGHRPGIPRKPDPTAALVLAAELGHAPADVAFVGDTAVDVQTALAAGMLPVGVRWGFRPGELTGAGATLVIERAEELLTLLQE